MAAKATKKGRYWYCEINRPGVKRKFQKQKDEATARWVAEQWNLRNSKEAPGLSGSKAFDDVAQRWWDMKSGNWRQTSQRSRAQGLKRLVKLLGKRDIRELGEDQVGLLAQQLCPPHTKYKVPTVAFTMGLLAEIVGWAVGKVIKEHPCNSDPKKTIRAIGTKVAEAKCAPPDTRDAWKYEEVDTLLRHLAEKGAWIYDPFYFSIRTGCRLGELVALQWKDLDVVRGLVTFRQSRSYREMTGTKSNKIRTRPLSDDILAHVRAMYARRLDDGFVFLNSQRKPFNADSLSSLWPKIRRKCKGVKQLPWHCTRHTWASWALDKGWTPAQGAWYLGHTEQVFREHYAHIIRDKHLDLNFFTPGGPAPTQHGLPRKADRKGQLALVK